MFISHQLPIQWDTLCKRISWDKKKVVCKGPKCSKGNCIKNFNQIQSSAH